MNTQNDLLFGMIAFQAGAVEADQLAETCALGSADGSVSLADRLVDRGCLTIEQKTQVERLVANELENHGGDAKATLAATVDGRFLDAIRDAGATMGDDMAHLTQTLVPVANYELVESLKPADEDESDRYTRTHLHAKGGMGQVWVARDGSLGRQIALKELRPEQTGNSIICSRFLYEAKITAQLEHPGIVPVYELGGGPVPFYTMRFVKGRTLSEATRAYHKERLAGTADSLALVKLLSAFLGVCHAVAYAHSRGIIHRDLKGQNVILGDFGEVIVLDWGIAKQVGPVQAAAPAAGGDVVDSSRPGSPDEVFLDSIMENGTVNPDETSPAATEDSNPMLLRPRLDSGAGPDGTMHGQLLGTPGFMAPEQAIGLLDQIDQRTDVYGLGAVLYEILTGSPPFTGKKTMEILYRVHQEPPRPPRECNPTVDPALQAICLKALSKPRAQRYASATDLAQEVERYLADEPVHACPDPWTRRALRWSRRHRTAVATAAGLLVTTTIALGVGTVLVTRERNEAKLQGKQARQAVDDMYTKVAENWLEDRLDPLQKEFLEKTLAHYQRLTGQAAGDPAVRLEHGRAFQRMGDIHRKLGRLDEANDAFRRALAILEPLHAAQPADGGAGRALALTRTHLGDLLVRRGQNDDAEPLYRQALLLQEGLVAAPNSAPEDRWLLARTLKSQADLVRRKGDFTGARPIYQQAIAALEKATAAAPALSDVRNDLALAEDAQGQLLMELGETKLAEDAFRRALKLLEPLVAEFPTIPRFRETLAKASNSLGMIEQNDGRAADSESHYLRELAEAERLTQDFPDRPEFRRELARGCTNLGGLLFEQSRAAEAETILRRGIALNADLTAKQPGDVQIRLDLAKCRHNLGCLLLENGRTEGAIAELEQARNLSSALVKQFPDAPRYRHNLAGDLRNLGRAYEAAEQGAAEASYQESLEISERLAREFPANIDYQIELGRCLNTLGAHLAAANKADQAESSYTRGLAVLSFKDQAARTTESLREQATLLSNLGELQRAGGRPGADGSLRHSIAIFEELAARKPAARIDRQTLAIAQNNLAEVLVAAGRAEEAGQTFAKSRAGLDLLASENSKAVDTQNYLGYVCEQQAMLQAKIGQPEQALQSIKAAVAHQRQAVKLTDGKVSAYRLMLAGHLGALARACLKLHAYDDAIRAAIDLPKAAPASEQGYLDAAKILVRCVAVANEDRQLDRSRRENIGRKCSGRIAILLREAIDSNPKLGERIKSDSELSQILARPEFQNLLGGLVNLGPARVQ